MLKTQANPIVANDTLVLYHGGCFEGCFWEWNAFYVDTNGVFMNIASSGLYGCEDLEKFTKNYEADYADYAEMFTESNLADFAKNFNEGIVLGILKFIDMHTTWALPKLTCDMCSEEFSYDELVPEGYCGCGGIEVSANEFRCDECVRKANTHWTITYLDEEGYEMIWEDDEATLWEPMHAELWDAIYPTWHGDDPLDNIANTPLPLEGLDYRFPSCLNEGETREVNIPAVCSLGAITITALRYDMWY